MWEAPILGSNTMLKCTSHFNGSHCAMVYIEHLLWFVISCSFDSYIGVWSTNSRLCHDIETLPALPDLSEPNSLISALLVLIFVKGIFHIYFVVSAQECPWTHSRIATVHNQIICPPQMSIIWCFIYVIVHWKTLLYLYDWWLNI